MRHLTKLTVLLMVMSCMAISSVVAAQPSDSRSLGEGAAVSQAKAVDVVIKVPANTEVYHNNQRIAPAPAPAEPAPPPPPPAPTIVRQTSQEVPPVYEDVEKKQKKKKKNYKVRVALGLAMLPIHLDVAVHEKVSLHSSFFLIYTGESRAYYGGILGGLDYYFIGRAPSGLSLGVRLGHIAWGSDGEKKTGLTIARSVLGYKWIWDHGFTMNIGLGIQYIRKEKTRSDREPVNYVLPHFELGVGVAF